MSDGDGRGGTAAAAPWTAAVFREKERVRERAPTNFNVPNQARTSEKNSPSAPVTAMCKDTLQDKGQVKGLLHLPNARI